MGSKTATAVVAFLAAFAATMVAWSAPSDREHTPDYREGEVLVGFRPGSDEQGRSRARDLARTLHVRRYRHVGMEKLFLGPGMTAEEAVELLRSDPDVEYAELNWRARYLGAPRVEPGDPYYVSGDQWHLDAEPFHGYHVTTGRTVLIDRDIDAPEAWAVMGAVFSPGMAGAVGVIDSGCGESGYFSPSTGYVPHHEDLPNSSLWANVMELVTPGLDSADANGYVDDVNGYDFWRDDNVMADDYGPDYNHGTFISGIIAAAWDNGLGCAGIGVDRLKVLPLRTAYLDDIVASIDYALGTTSGTPPVRVLNASWTFTQPLQSLQQAIEAAGSAGIAFVAAAANDGKDNDLGAQAYPAEYTKVPLDNVLAVAASDSTGGLAWFSNYGPSSVQMAAPGQDIRSVYGGTSQYVISSGTSFAAPIAASALALIMSAHPGFTPAEAIDRLMGGGDFDARLAGLVRSGKRVNLAGALAPFTPYSGYAPLDTLQPLSLYTDPVSALYGSLVSAVSGSPSVATMVALPGGAWAVSPVSPGLTTFTLEFDGVSAPVNTYETGTWRVTGISPFFSRVGVGHTLAFRSLIPHDSVEWAVTNPAVGTIDSDGVFTALSSGTTRIVLNVDGRDVDNSGVVLVVVMDGDGDGYEGSLDCDDTDPDINPGAGEICGDGLDNDCDGDVDTGDSDCHVSVDGDGDGYEDSADCDDTDPDVNPGADEVCKDGIDNDCDGDADDRDSDCQTDNGDGSGGGGCGTTTPPGNAPWTGIMETLSVLMFLILKRWRTALWSPESTLRRARTCSRQ